jgi:hypothetical protein
MSEMERLLSFLFYEQRMETAVSIGKIKALHGNFLSFFLFAESLPQVCQEI